jgi:chemotaxis response regulator CheB
MLSVKELPCKKSDMTCQDFYFIGIGICEGGVEPLRTILSSLPVEPNAAFFVLNHLPPDLRSFTAQALQYHTTMPIHEAVEDMVIKPGQLYCLPINHYIRLYNGSLKLEKREPKPTSNYAINKFLDSLAGDVGCRAIGILLSGSGDDGVKGLENILRQGGITIVQDPETAANPQTPKAAIEAGVVIFIRKPGGIAKLLAELIKS